VKIFALSARWVNMRRSTEANRFLNNHLHLRRNVLNSRCSDNSDRLLDCRGHELGHLHRDMLHSAFRDLDHSLLDDGVAGEDREIGLGDDLELHPRDFSEHLGELLVDDDDDENTIVVAKPGAKVKFADNVFTGKASAFGDEPEAILNGDILGRGGESFETPS